MKINYMSNLHSLSIWEMFNNQMVHAVHLHEQLFYSTKFWKFSTAFNYASIVTLMQCLTEYEWIYLAHI